jgi:hypothetical protein
MSEIEKVAAPSIRELRLARRFGVRTMHGAAAETEGGARPVAAERRRRRSTVDRSTAPAVIGEQLDGVAEAAHWMFADPFELEIALDKIGESAGQQHGFP